jgi:type I restriction enzyme S subunit
MKEQIQIVEHIDNTVRLIEKSIDRVNNQVKLFGEYKIRLISDVVTGKIDVSNVPAPEFEIVEEPTNDELMDEVNANEDCEG